MMKAVRERGFDARKLALAALILGLGLLSISNRSLWHDEVSHAQYIAQGDLAATVRNALKFGKLGYLLIEYLWGALLRSHTSEFALRCSNLVFTLIAIYYALRIVERRNWPLWGSLLFFVHPMYVYYMNEVTPYILLYALALGFTYHVFLSGEQFSQPRNIVAINVLFLLGVFVHFIFGFAVLLYFTRCFMTIRRQRRLILRHAGIMLSFGVGYLPMLYLILRYMDGTANGFSVVNPLYVLYSFLGMAGLGIPREDLRARNFAAITAVEIFLLVLCCMILLAILALMIRRDRGFLRRERDLLLPMLVYFAVLIPVAMLMHFGMWERHCIVVFPLYILLFGDLMFELSRKRAGKTLFIMLFALLLISCARLRFDKTYARDDYKGLYAELTAELQTNDDLLVLLQRKNYYYTLDDALTSPKQAIVSIDGMKSLAAHELFLSHIERGDDVVLVLSVDIAPYPFFHHYDDDPAFIVNNDYTSFKLIRPAT